MRELLKNIAALPDLEIGQTPDDFKCLAERTLEAKEKVIYYIGSVELLLEAYEQAYENNYYIPTRIERNILVKMLAPDTPAMRAYRATDDAQIRQTRALPKDVVMDYAVMIHDDQVVFFAQDPQLYALAITSPSIAVTMKAMFNAIWTMAH
ncbi:MAG: hypothetical protein N3B18_09930 [Desulfobacterota bacterium]|nr:hypothetical protein [Thermodesulfobacteriota bacterium]